MRTAAIYAGKLAAYWNLPLFSFSSTNPELIDKTMFSTLVRVMSPFNHMATALRHVFNFFGVSIIFSRVASSDSGSAHTSWRCSASWGLRSSAFDGLRAVHNSHIM